MLVHSKPVIHTPWSLNCGICGALSMAPSPHHGVLRALARHRLALCAVFTLLIRLDSSFSGQPIRVCAMSTTGEPW